MNLRTMVLGLSILASAAFSSIVAHADPQLDGLIKNPSNWAAQAGDYSNHRYSPLKQINESNVGKLQVAWTMSTGVLRGHEGAPLVIGDTMYIHSPFPNKVIAINLKDQTFIWQYQPKQDESVVSVMCCDTVNRGLAYGDGKIFLQQADTKLVALNAKTGDVVWTAQNGNPKAGETNTNAPHVFGDKVLTGISGGEFGVRGRLIAYDIKSGKMVWTAYSTGPDKEMLLNPDKTMTYADGKMVPVGADSSLKSWKGDQWKLGGGTTWGWYAWDPKLNLVYYGTGNPGTWNPTQRPGDNKWSLSIFARDLNTGEAKWVYQMTPHDEWDYDGVNEMILSDLTIGGKKVPAIVHFDRNGFGYTLNRETGQLLVAEKFDPAVNWAERVDIKSGLPIRAAAYSTQAAGSDHNVKGICPAALGSKDQQPAAFDPATSLFLVPTNHVCMDYEPFDVDYVSGQPYVAPRSRCTPARRAATRWATSSHGTRRRARSSGPSRSASRCGPARSPRPAGLLSTARSKATSRRFASRTARNCGASRPRRGSSATCSPTSIKASSSSASTRALAAGPASAWRRASRSPPKGWARSAAIATSRSTRRWAARCSCSPFRAATADAPHQTEARGRRALATRARTAAASVLRVT